LLQQVQGQQSWKDATQQLAKKLVQQVREGFEQARRNGSVARIMAPLNRIYGRGE